MTDTLAILDALAAEMRDEANAAELVAQKSAGVEMSFWFGASSGLVQAAALVQAAIARIRAEGEGT